MSWMLARESLHQFVDEWWALYAEPRLAPGTLRFYAVS